MFTIIDKAPIPPCIASDVYMNNEHLAYFSRVLLDNKTQLLAEIQGMDLAEPEEMIDPLDRAAQEMDRQAESRGFERALQQIREIDLAMKRIEAGEYGYCEATGEEIGMARLLARPTARLSFEAQQAQENKAKLGLR